MPGERGDPYNVGKGIDDDRKGIEVRFFRDEEGGEEEGDEMRTFQKWRGKERSETLY